MSSVGAVAGVVGSAGCLDLVRRRERLSPDGDDRTTVVDGTPSDRIQLSNGSVFATFDPDANETAAGVHAFGFRNGANLAGPVETNPVTPASTLDSAQLEYERLRDVTVTRDDGCVGQYRVRREYTLGGTRLGIDWTVSLPAGEPFALCAIRLENRDDESIVLNHSDGDTHDGILLLRAFGLAGREPSNPAYQFATDGHGPGTFDEQPLWRSLPGIRRVTVFDEAVGVTCGYLEGDTGPKFAVLREDAIDFMVNESILEAGSALTYRMVVAAHGGQEGTAATERGSELYDRARRWEHYK